MKPPNAPCIDHTCMFIILEQVIDDVDCMFDSGLSLETRKILRHLPDYTTEITTKRLQTILVASTITEV